MKSLLPAPVNLQPLFNFTAGSSQGKAGFFHVFLIILSILFYLWVLKDNLEVKFDDAYMYIRYANHILAGAGHSWNIAEGPVYGSTSMFYSGIVVFLKAVSNLSDSAILIFASGTLGFLSIGTLAFIKSHILGQGSYLKSLALCLALFVFTTPYLYHANSGMDTTLSLLFNTLLILSVLLYIKKQLHLYLLLVTLVAFLAIAARPDNIICAILFPVLSLLLFVDKGVTRSSFFLAGLAVLLALDALVKYRTLGDFLPLAFFAKRHGFYEGYVGQYQWNPVEFVLMFIAACIPWLVMPDNRRDQLWYRLALVFLLPVILTAAYYLTVQQIMGYFARYYFPFLPYIVVFVFILLAKDSSMKKSAPKPIFRIVMQAVLAYLLVFAAFKTLPPFYIEKVNATLVHYQPEAKYVSVETEQLPEIRYWNVLYLLGDFVVQLPSGARIAMSEYGYLGSRAMQIDIIDTIGLHDRQIAHNGFDVDLFFAKQPDIIWFPNKDYTRLNAMLVDAPYFQANYEYYPDALLYGFAINRNSEHYALISNLFDELWQKAYGARSRYRYRAYFGDLPVP